MNIGIVSTAVSFYQKSSAIENHKKYALKYNYSYSYASNSSLNGLNYADISFLRYNLLRASIYNYDYLVWISADALFKENCPEIPLHSDIQLAKDSSGFFNFGFGIYKNTDYTRTFLDEIINSKKDLYNQNAKEYEINRIFNYAQDNFDIHELGKEWNNTFDINLDCNVIHYSKELSPYRKSILNLDIIDTMLSL